jgi:hypothetical protein
VRFHRSQSRSMLEGQSSQAGQLYASRERTKTRRVRRSGNRGVVRCRRQRIVRKGGRRRRCRVGRIWPGPLDMSQGSSVMVIIMLLTRMRSGHLVRRQRRQVTTRAVLAMAVVRVVSRAVVGRRSECLPLDLVRCLCQHGDVPVARVQSSVRHAESRVGMRRRDVGGRQSRRGGRSNSLWSRRRRHNAFVGQMRAMLLV